MACRKFMRGYRGNVVARTYNAAKMEHVEKHHRNHPLSSSVSSIEEEEGIEPVWFQVDSSQVPQLGGAPTLINLPDRLSTADEQEQKTKPVALFNVEGEVYAMHGLCPHMGGPLQRGQVKGERVQCPWHKWCINVKTGQIGDMEDIVQPTYEVKREGGNVMVCTRARRKRGRHQPLQGA